MSTPQRILNLLNREALSVSELATRLGISRNSTHVHVTKLEAAGALKKTRRETSNGVGKPASLYKTVARHEDLFSSAYKSVLGGLMEAIGEHLAEEERSRLLRDAGRLLAKASGLAPTSDFESDLQKALDAVNSLGAMAECSSSEQAPIIRCHTCPIATLVHDEPAMCSLVASFFSEATARPVTVQCRHEKTVVCGFSFGVASGNNTGHGNE